MHVCSPMYHVLGHVVSECNILVVSVCILCSVVHSHLHSIVTVTKHAQCVCIISGLIDELLKSWSGELLVLHTPQH